MKKISLLLALILLFVLCSCSIDFGTNSTSIDTEKYNESDLASNITLMSQKNIVTKNVSYASDYIFGEDSDNYYIAFHMGYMENVPLTDTYEYKYYSGVGYYKEEFTTVETTQDALKTTLSDITDTYHEDSETTTWNVNVSAEAKFQVGAVNAKVKVSGGFQKSNSSVDYSLDKHEETTESCSSYTKTMTKSKTIVFDGSMPAGYYAYRFVGIIDQYNLVVVPKSDYQRGVLNATVVPFGTIMAYGFSLDYNAESGVFKGNESQDKFIFDINVVNQVLEERFGGNNSNISNPGENCTINIGMFYDYPGLKEYGHGPVFETASNENHKNHNNPTFHLTITDNEGAIIYNQINEFKDLGQYFSTATLSGYTLSITPNSSGQGCWGYYEGNSGYYEDQCDCLAFKGKAFYEPLVIKLETSDGQIVYQKLTTSSYSFVVSGNTTITILYEVPESEHSGDWYINGRY